MYLPALPTTGVKDLLNSTHLHDHLSRNCEEFPDSLLVLLIMGTSISGKVEWTDLELCTSGNYTTKRETILRVRDSQLLAVYILKWELLSGRDKIVPSKLKELLPFLRHHLLDHAGFLPDHFPYSLRKNTATLIILKIFQFSYLTTVSSSKERWLLFQ